MDWERSLWKACLPFWREEGEWEGRGRGKRGKGKRGGRKEEEKWRRKGGGRGGEEKEGEKWWEERAKVLKQLCHHFYAERAAIVTAYLINAKWNVPEWFVLCSSIQHHLLIHSPEIFEITWSKRVAWEMRSRLVLLSLVPRPEWGLGMSLLAR